MTAVPEVPTRPDDRGRAARPSGHPRMVLAVLAAVIVLDQATKWWGWRHVPGALMNPGGDQLVGSTVGAWYSAQLSGAVLDLQGAVVLALAVSLLTHVRRRVVLVPAAMVIAGWCSNVLDRLGLHFWTAPGSVRGAVDFIRIGDSVYNAADFFIIGGTGFLLAAVAHAVATRQPAIPSRPRLALRRARRSPLARFATALAAGGLIAAVTVGATLDTGVISPTAAEAGTSSAP